MNKDFHDIDHVQMKDGKIYRVVGNFDDADYFFGYNVYIPHLSGDREWRGSKYRKNFIEDENLPDDVFATYQILPKSEVVLHINPVQAAQDNSQSFANSVWFDLYGELQQIFGKEAVGIFGSSMFNLHLTPQGKVRKDVDFVIDGLENIMLLRNKITHLREKLGFTEVNKTRQLRQYERYQKVFRNQNNTIKPIIARRWTGLQLSEDVVSTIRFRDTRYPLSLQYVTNTPIETNYNMTGVVIDADKSNLFPRTFTLENEKGRHQVYMWWWKFSTPVREGDVVEICGDLVKVDEFESLRVTNFRNHWLRFIQND